MYYRLWLCSGYYRANVTNQLKYETEIEVGKKDCLSYFISYQCVDVVTLIQVIYEC